MKISHWQTGVASIRKHVLNKLSYGLERKWNKWDVLFSEDGGQQLICERLTCETSCHHVCTQWEAPLVFSLIMGLFSDLLPGQAWKEVTFPKMCLNGDDMYMCWHKAPLPAFYHHSPPPCQKRNCACFLFSRFLLLFPNMQTSARESTLIVCSNACSNLQLHAETPIKWRAGLETGIMLILI